MFEEMDDWEFSNKILKMKKQRDTEQLDTPDVLDSDSGNFKFYHTIDHIPISLCISLKF